MDINQSILNHFYFLIYIIAELSLSPALNLIVLLISTRRNLVLGQTIRTKPKTSSSKFKKLSSSICNQKQNAIITQIRHFGNQWNYLQLCLIEQGYAAIMAVRLLTA